MGRRRAQPEEIERRHELFSKGHTADQVAAMLGYKVSSIRRWATNNGYSHGKRISEYLTDEVLRAAVESKMSLREIAMDFGIGNTKKVSKRIAEMGLTTHRKKQLNPWKIKVRNLSEPIGEYVEDGHKVTVYPAAYARGAEPVLTGVSYV